MNEPVVIWLPLPPREVTPHNKGHWAKKAKHVRQYRQTAQIMAANEARRHGAFTGRVVVHHCWNMAKGKVSDNLYRPRDEGNAIQALKPAIDGLRDAGLFVDDDMNRLTWGDCSRTQEGRPGVTLTIVLEAPGG